MNKDPEGKIEKNPSLIAASLATAAVAYAVGYEQGRVQAEVAERREPHIPRPPPKGYSRAEWNSLHDDQKVHILAERVGANNLLIRIASIILMDSLDDHAARRQALESIGHIFCMGCGDIQRINEHGHLDWCQCQNSD